MSQSHKFAIVDNRMRNIEKEYISSLQYTLISLEKNDNVYFEISSHTDIFCSKIYNTLIIQPDTYDKINSYINTSNTPYNCKKLYNLVKIL
jgi:hypothetical protein